MFAKSDFYRDDIWIGRYCASPTAAWLNLLTGLCLIIKHLVDSTLVISGMGWLFFLMPGVWLFSTGFFFMGWLAASMISQNEKASYFVTSDGTWLGQLTSREGLAFIIGIVLAYQVAVHNL